MVSRSNARRVAATAGNLAALLAAAQSEGCEQTVLTLAWHWRRSLLSMQRLRRLGQQVGRSWVYLARLLSDVEKLADPLSEWSRPGTILAAPVPPLEHLLAAARCRGRELPKHQRGAVEKVIRRLERQLASSPPGKETAQQLRQLEMRLGRVETAIEELRRAAERSHRKRPGGGGEGDEP